MSDFDNVQSTQPQATSVEPTPAPSDIGAPSSPQSTTPTAPQPPATGGGQEALVPSYRLREIRTQYEQQLQQQLQQERTRWQGELDAREKKIQALAGVLPQEVTQEDAIREQFSKLFPHLGSLTAEKISQLEKVLERSSALEAENELRWQSHGHQSLQRLFSLAQEAGLPDNEQVRGTLHNALVGYLSANPQEQQRFAVDPNFIPEFFKAYATAMIDPLRRTQAAAAQGRVVPPLPQDAPSGAVRTTTQAPKPQSLEERANLSWTAFQQSKQGR